ncbi:MAG: hypothetical protein JST04_10175 [Bdellovibrionales bacterium]|nr:hypothetical protein [Bdellovibrionales bacterium]
MKSIFGVLVFGSIASLSFVGCNDTGFGISNQAQTEGVPDEGSLLVEEFKVPTVDQATKIDVLFMIDNSQSMSPEQTIIGQSFTDFIAEFQKKNVDFHLGVITTDVDSAPKKFATALTGYVNPTGPGALLTRYAGEPYFTPQTTDLLTKFPENAKVGVDGSSHEQGLKSVISFLDPSRLAAGGANAGFIREDALLSVIFVSDEDENEAVASGDTIDGRIGALVDRVKALKGPLSRGYRFDFIINENAKKPKVLPLGSDPIPLGGGTNGSNNPYPSVYLRAADLTGSQTLDVQTNFASGLADIGANVVKQGQSEFKLSARPNAASLRVALDGVAVPADPTDGYVLHDDRNTIELRGSALAGSPGKSLVVKYAIDAI